MTYYMNPHPALWAPLSQAWERGAQRAGYRNCLYGHDITHPTRLLRFFQKSNRIALSGQHACDADPGN